MLPRPLALSLSLLLVAGVAHAADGNLDPTFWGDGRYVSGAAPDELYVAGVVEAPDGALVWVGSRRTPGPPSDYTARWRRLTDGVESGCELALPSTSDLSFIDADFDADGRLVLGGWAQLVDGTYRLFFARYLYPSCVLDPDFDLDGVTLLDVGAPDNCWVGDLLVAGDRILFAGVADFAGASNLDGIAGRLLDNGAWDPTFSSNGWVALDGRAGHDVVTRIARAPDGTIYAGGWSLLPDNTDRDFALWALQPNGQPVSSFGLDGFLSIDFGASSADPYDSLDDLALMPDGRILLAGIASLDVAPGYGGALAMVTPGGTLDSGFGSGGLLVDPSRGEYKAVAVQGNGRIVLGAVDDLTKWLVARRLADGSPDPGFAGGAWVPIAFVEGGYHGLSRVALQDGRPVVAGFLERAAPDPDLAVVVRLTNGYVFADGFDIGATDAWSGVAP